MVLFALSRLPISFTSPKEIVGYKLAKERQGGQLARIFTRADKGERR